MMSTSSIAFQRDESMSIIESEWRQLRRQARARLDTCEKLENSLRQIFGNTACEAVAVRQQLAIVGGFESEEFWKELYVRIYRPLFFARAQNYKGDLFEL